MSTGQTTRSSCGGVEDRADTGAERHAAAGWSRRSQRGDVDQRHSPAETPMMMAPRPRR